MKFIANENGRSVVELSRRNLRALLVKLDDPLSLRTLVDPDGVILVRAVDMPDGGSDAKLHAALAVERVVELTRAELQTLLAALDSPLQEGPMRTLDRGDLLVRAVADEAHYRDRPPGVLRMPSSGELM